MKPEYQKYIIDGIFDFFQYPENYDKIIIENSMKNMDYRDGIVTLESVDYKLDDNTREGLLGFYLANLPAVLVKKKFDKYVLTPRLMKLKNDSSELIRLKKFNELATLDLYLLLEMSLRCSYSKWLGDRITITGNGNEYNMANYDYRKLKLYIRRKGLNSRDVLINGRPFPGSQLALLNWASHFTDRNTGLLFRLALNVRNLLAHGENEWPLFPVNESVDYAASVAESILEEIKPGKDMEPIKKNMHSYRRK